MPSNCEACGRGTARVAITVSDERSPRDGRDEHRDANKVEDGADDDIDCVHVEGHGDDGKMIQR